MAIQSLREVILYVADMGTSVRFWRDEMGLAVEYPSDRDDLSGESWVKFAVGIALHAGGTGATATSELVFQVDDLDATIASLAARGVTLGPVRELFPGVRICTDQDPDGHVFSLREG